METNPEIKLQVLICTFGKTGINRLSSHSLPKTEGVEYLISWQNYSESPDIPESLHRPDIKVCICNSTGLSKNRNNALALCSATFCLIADDDLDFDSLGLLSIIDNFIKCPEIDIATYQYTGDDNKRYPDKTFDLRHPPEGYFVSSIEIAFRRNPIIESGIKFDERFGIGAEFIAGEENIWISKLLKSGLKGRFFPVNIANHAGMSSGVRAHNDPELICAKGACFAIIHPISWPLRMIAHSLPGRRPPKVSACAYIKNWLNGVLKTILLKNK